MKIVHLSDLHLSVPGIPWRDFLGERFFARVNLLTTRRGVHSIDVAKAAITKTRELGPDHVVITGDFSNMAHPLEFEKAREVLEPIWNPGLLSVVPGNHDFYVRSGETNFIRYFGELIWGPTGSRKFPGFKIIGKGVALLLFRSPMYLPGPISFGNVTEDQLVRAKALLDSVRPTIAIAAFHHNIHKRGPMVELTGRLIGRDRLVQRLARLGVKLILTGHDHRHREYEIEVPGTNPVKVVCSGSSSLSGKKGHAVITEITIDTKTSKTSVVKVFRYDPASGEFVEDKGSSKIP